MVTYFKKRYCNITFEILNPLPYDDKRTVETEIWFPENWKEKSIQEKQTAGIVCVKDDVKNRELEVKDNSISFELGKWKIATVRYILE